MDVSSVELNTWLNGDELSYIKQVHENWNRIPLLNAINIQDLQERKLIRFKGMIQDMFDPEFYYDQYEVTSKVTKEKYVKRGKYLDTVNCNDGEYINFESKQNVTKERQTFVVISPPGLNDWALNMEKEFYHQKSLALPEFSSRMNTSIKRSLADNEEHQEESSQNLETNMEVEETESYSKKQCTSKPHEELSKPLVVSQQHLLNFPLPNRTGKACHLKLYENADNLKLNELIDCVGFLSMDGFYETSNAQPEEDLEDAAMELQTHNPPTSLIPKIHCVAYKKLIECNPLYEIDNEKLPLEAMYLAKKELEIVFTQLLLGDQLAAQYLIYHLISKVYSRQELLALGKFTLNISNIPNLVLPEYGQQFYDILQQLIPKSHYLPMSLENMNDLAFIPKKDYECNRITSGILQLSDQTHLVLDENKLSSGKLNSEGVRAVAALSNVIKNQRMHYDFNFYQMDFDCDIPILVLSEGKSLLPSDCHVVLKPEEEHIRTFEEVQEALKVYLKPELLIQIRRYLMYCRHAEYVISENINELVQNEFVKMRASENSTAEDLHSLLVLARSVCLADGKHMLDETCWRLACNLEYERKTRLR